MKRISVLFLLSLVVFSACKDDDDVIEPMREPSYLHMVGASAQDTFDVVFDYYNADAKVITSMYNRRNWPSEGYAEIEAAGTPDEFGNGKLWVYGIREVNLVGQDPDTVFGGQDIILADNAKSTLAIADSGGSVIVRKFDDAYTATGAVRFLNLNEGFAGGSLTTSDGSLNIGGTADFEASAYNSLPGGVYTFELRDAGGAVITSISNVEVYGSQSAITFFVGANNTFGYYRH